MAFTDSFTGTENQNLEDRSGWTNVDAPTGGAQINASNALKNNSTQSVSSYKCTDQGSADHYTQAAFLAATVGCFGIAVRLTNGNNFIGCRYESGAWQLWKRNAGAFTSLGSYSTSFSSGDIGYLEASGDSITVKVNGTTRVGPVTESFNNTETRQGLIPRGTKNTSWIDDFEAGALGGGGATVTLNQATETDTAQPVGKAKYKAIGQASGTETAQAFTAVRRVALGQVSESDTAQALGRVKIKALGQPAETDTAQPIAEAGAITATMGQVVESDTAQAFASVKTKAIGQAVESGIAQAVTPARRVSVGQVAETDSAQAFASVKTKAFGQAAETDTAQPISIPGVQIIALGMVTETEFAQAIAAYKRIGILQPVETDSAHSITAIKRKAFGQVVETDAALGIVVDGGTENLTVECLTAPTRTTLTTAPTRTTLTTAPTRTTLIESRHAIHR